jgi:hypothetical protein
MREKIPQRDYLAAGAVSNILILVYLTILPYIGLRVASFSEIIIRCILAITGSVLSIYLLKNKTGFYENSVLLYSSLTSYFVYLCISILYGLWANFNEDILIIVCFLVGGIIGNLLPNIYS